MTRPEVVIVSRNQWGARRPKSRYAIATPTRELWWHHFASEHHGARGMRDIQRFHMDTKGWSDIAYSFCVDDDGTIYEGRGAGIAGGHTKNRNSISHAICLMGNFQTRPVRMPALKACASLAVHGMEHGWWNGWTNGHRHAPGASTACPGDFAMRAFTDLKALTALYLTGHPTPQEDDMGDYLEAIEAIYELQWGRRMKPEERLHWITMLRTKAEGPQWVVNEVARQLEHPAVFSA